jgi:hypothetical protein
MFVYQTFMEIGKLEKNYKKYQNLTVLCIDHLTNTNAYELSRAQLAKVMVTTEFFQVILRVLNLLNFHIFS